MSEHKPRWYIRHLTNTSRSSNCFQRAAVALRSMTDAARCPSAQISSCGKTCPKDAWRPSVLSSWEVVEEMWWSKGVAPSGVRASGSAPCSRRKPRNWMARGEQSKTGDLASTCRGVRPPTFFWLMSALARSSMRHTRSAVATSIRAAYTAWCKAQVA
eukprot:scaffold8405_cov117-Isochrysis_galbana.AAC.3